MSSDSPASFQPLPTCRILGVDIHRTTSDGLVDHVMAAIKARRRMRLVTLNTTGMMMVEDNEFFRRYVNEAELVVADGQPLIWLSTMGGQPPLPERVPGVELISKFAEAARHESLSVYLLGAEPETVELAAQRLQHDHPDLKIAGFHHGFLGQDAANVAVDIGLSGATFLFVAMGSPRQEEFVSEFWPELGVSLAIGVGGSFEVLAGKASRAPAWMRKTGLEWLHRASLEPRRLGPRYLATGIWLLKRFPALVKARLGA